MTPTLRQLLPLLVWLVAVVVAPAQVTEDPQTPTTDEIQARIEALKDSEAPEREELVGIYTDTLQALAPVTTLEELADRFEQQASGAPERLDDLRAALDTPVERAEPEVPAEITLRELEQQEQQAETDRVAAQRLVDELTEEAQHRAQRLGLLTEEITTARAEVNERESALRAAKTGDVVDEARRLLLISQLAASRARARMLAAEREAYVACRDLLPLRRDQARRELTRAEQLLGFWRGRTASLRQEETERAARDAERRRREIAASFPDLEEIAERCEELAANRSGPEGLAAKMSSASDALLAAEQLRDETARRYQATWNKVRVAGNSRGMGRLLRREYDWTSGSAVLRAASRERRRQLSDAQYLQIELQEERAREGDLTTRHEALMASLDPSGTDTDVAELSALARELLESLRTLLNASIDELGTLIGTLGKHELVHEELVETTATYREFIGERILWMPSTEGGLIPSLSDAGNGLTWLFTSAEWPEGIERSLDGERREWAVSVLLLAAALALLLLRRRVREALAQTADEVRSYRTDRFQLTVRGLGLTIGLALPMPLLVWSIGWFLSAPVEQVEVADSLGLALQSLCFTFGALELLRQLALPRGLGEAHFRWPGVSMAALRAELTWFLPIAMPLELMVLTFDHQSEAIWTDSTGRIAFLGLCVAAFVLTVRLFRPSTRLLAGHYRKDNSLLERTHKGWFALLLAVPLTQIVLTLSGYYYSAWQFDTQVRHSIGLGIVLLLAHALASRWLFIERRRMALEQARQRALAKSQPPDTGEGNVTRESGPGSLDEQSVDIPAVDAQTRQLFRSCITVAALFGFFFIWADVLPALRALERIQLWPQFHVVEVRDALSVDPAPVTAETAPAADPSIEALPLEAQPTIVTLADLVGALILFLLTGIAAKNAPGLLEIAILQRLPLESSSRFALSTLFRYSILIVGLSLGFAALGIGWSKVQWLAAALTFGLGFGLQEIFANFVSGIIILVERPIRTGDIVTVAGTMGRITKLRMRATTILDWDRRELLVPNKEFITGSLVNWTLSDPVTRVVVPVGVAYGSDTRLTRELLLKVADENEIVQGDPRPSAVFMRFGESSLDFELRVYLDNRDLWPELITRLHTEIDDAFREAGIEIAFPQRDLHLRTADGLEGRGMVPPRREPDREN